MVQLSPGSRVIEKDLSGIIPSVSTTEGALAGQFIWGPVNERVLIESESELVRTFGEPINANADDWFTASNFLAYSNKLWTVRVVDENNANTALRAKNATSSNTSGFLVKNRDDYNTNYIDGTLETSFAAGPWVAKYAGELGNSLKISTCASSEAYQSSVTGTVSVTAGQKVVTGVGTNFTSEITVGDLMVINNETHKVSTVSNTTSMILATSHVGGASANTSVRRWEYYVEVDVAPGTSTYASNRGGADDEIHVVIVDEDGSFTDQPGTILEVYQQMSMAVDGKLENGASNYYKNRINEESKYVWWASHDDGLVGAGSKSTATFTGSVKPLNSSLVGGTNGTDIGNDERIRGYNKFVSTEEVEISLILGAAANQTVAVHLINNIAEVRKDCIVLLSPPRVTAVNNEGNEAVDITNFRNTLPSTSYATLDSGWKYQYDLYNDVYRYVPLNGDVAGLYVRTDQDRDPWWAAAGFNRGHIKNATKLSWSPSKADRDILYKNGVNPVANFPNEGPVLFGNKTLLNKPSAFDRVNVRRLFIVMEKAIKRASEYLLFEFNDEYTRQSFVNMVEPYLRDIQGRRGISSFAIICDSSNNTPEVIDRNEFVGEIYIAPARTAEFITLTFVATRTGVDFNTIVRRG